MNRVLVTGGSGFVGSHLCERLMERDDEVLKPGWPALPIRDWFRKELELE